MRVLADALASGEPTHESLAYFIATHPAPAWTRGNLTATLGSDDRFYVTSTTNDFAATAPPWDPQTFAARLGFRGRG